MKNFDIKKIHTRATAIGFETKNLITLSDSGSLLFKGENVNIIYIPDNIVKLNGEGKYSDIFNKQLKGLSGRVRIYGGSGLKDITGMFSECSFSSYDFSYFDTSNVEIMDKMFEGCIVDTLDISQLDTSKVKSMIGMFRGCQGKEVAVYGINTGELCNIDSMFESVTMNNLRVELLKNKVTDMQRMFWKCNVKNLKLELYTDNVQDMTSMFAFSTIPSINMSSFNTDKVTTMQEMFCYCDIKDINFAGINTENVKNMSWMFAYSKTDNIDMSKLDTSGLTDMKKMFMGCNTEEIDLSHIRTRKVHNMGQMFMNCIVNRIKGLEYFDTSCVRDMAGMFRYCRAEYIDTLSFVIGDRTIIGDIFYGVTGKLVVHDKRLIDYCKKYNIAYSLGVVNN